MTDPSPVTDRSGPAARRPASAALGRVDLRRSADDYLVAGVCGGLGARLGVDPVVLRLALVALSFAGGFGVLAYLVAWGLTEQQVTDSPPRGRTPRTTNQQAASVALITVGLLLLLRSMGLWFGDGLVWPVAAAALGSGLLWARDDQARLAWLRRGPEPGGGPVSLGSSLAEVGVPRLLLGALLVGAGMVGFLAANDGLSALTDLGLAIAVAVAGLVLLLGPWLSTLVRQLGDERRERIRTEERAAMAAHLHDSVLQTLALIQRAADEPARTRALARRQERELRAWLYGQPGAGGGDEPTTWGEALARLATDLEQDHDVRVEAVVVGDGPVAAAGAAGGALVAAVREAVTNAAKHAGVPAVDVYLEVEDAEVVATVRDRGAGFDPDEVADDRHGIRQSIRARLERAGGRATLVTSPGEGTEWELRVPRPEQPDQPDASDDEQAGPR